MMLPKRTLVIGGIFLVTLSLLAAAKMKAPAWQRANYLRSESGLLIRTEKDAIGQVMKYEKVQQWMAMQNIKPNASVTLSKTGGSWIISLTRPNKDPQKKWPDQCNVILSAFDGSIEITPIVFVDPRTTDEFSNRGGLSCGMNPFAENFMML